MLQRSPDESGKQILAPFLSKLRLGSLPDFSGPSCSRFAIIVCVTILSAMAQAHLFLSNPLQIIRLAVGGLL